MNNLFFSISILWRPTKAGELAIRLLRSLFHLKRNNSHDLEARLAIYDSKTAPPRIQTIRGSDAKSFVEKLAQDTHRAAVDKGCRIPYAVIREIVENLIHADFTEVVISISSDGRYIRISDQGPGIADIEKAFSPGFSTATRSMKSVIKGVGSGLPIVKDFLAVSGGEIVVEDNLGNGTVVTLYDVSPINHSSGETETAAASEDSPAARPASSTEATDGTASARSSRAPDGDLDPAVQRRPQTRPIGRDTRADGLPAPALTARQQNVLALVSRLGQLGPSDAAAELGISLSTAFRDLVVLEENGLVSSDSSGKRRLTESGAQFLAKYNH